MKCIKTFIIDSHVLMRQTISSIIRECEGITIVKSEEDLNLQEINSEIRQTSPDVVLLGINELRSKEMELFFRIRKTFPKLPVIVLTPLTREGAKIALSTLKNGAVEYITKPERKGVLMFAREHFKKRLIPALYAIPELNARRLDAGWLSGQPAGKQTSSPHFLDRDREMTSVDLIVISSCSTGIRSLYTLMSGLPGQFSVPIVIIEHMPKLFTRELASDLELVTPSGVDVRELTHNSQLKDGQVYVVPGGWHAVVKNEGFKKIACLHNGPREHRSRPSIDVFLRSASQVYQNRLLSVFLSGGGEDGVSGARKVSEAGGQILVESWESALLWDLPSRIVREKIHHACFPAYHLSHEIARRSPVAESRELYEEFDRDAVYR